MSADPIFEQLLAEMRDREEDLLLQRLSAYAGAVATAVALAATFLPFGHPVAVFFVAEPVLCTAAGLGVAEYVLRRGGGDV